jgi:hypothetical protein
MIAQLNMNGIPQDALTLLEYNTLILPYLTLPSQKYNLNASLVSPSHRPLECGSINPHLIFPSMHFESSHNSPIEPHLIDP